MECKFFNDISAAWVQEKLNCTNANERERTRRIEWRIRSKFEEGPKYFTAEEFKDFLIWKGLARSVPAFLERYNNTGKVEQVTKVLFTNDLFGMTFADTQDESSKNRILRAVNILYSELQGLYFVGPGVASACVALCWVLIFHTSSKPLWGNTPPMFEWKIRGYQVTGPLPLLPYKQKAPVA